MSTRKSSRFSTQSIVMIGMMAAMAFVSNYIRIPLLDSKIHIGNAVCVLNGLLFGPLGGFLSSGIGNMLFDLMTGYGAECLITMVSKGAISAVCGALAWCLLDHPRLEKKDYTRLIIACVLGALTYVVLYMLKTFIFGLTVNGLTLEATGLKMLSKLPASLINAVFAAIAAPVLYSALHPVLRKLGLRKNACVSNHKGI